MKVEQKGIDRISSLHDDLLTPQATRHLGDYKEYPVRFDPSESSVILRLQQFGVDLAEVSAHFQKDIKELTWDEYTEVVARAIKAKYDVIVGSVFDQYTFPNDELPPTDEVRLQKLLELTQRYRDMDTRYGMNLIRRKSDFKVEDNLVLGLEGGANLIHDLHDLERIVAADVKIFGMQYNRDSPLATANGLTRFGTQAVRYLFDQNLIVDLAHSSFNTRRDVIQLAGEMGKGTQVAYTHGCTEEDVIASWHGKIGQRALTQAEVVQIVRAGGIVGLGVTKPFFDSTRKLAERIDRIAQISGGIDHVGIGSDFGGIEPQLSNEIKSPRDFSILGDVLARDFNMSDVDIVKVLRTNTRQWLEAAIS